jgi:hypothetical protein
MTALLSPPIRPHNNSKWVIVPCISDTCTCRMRIVLNTLTHQSQIEEVSLKEEVFVVGVDIQAWDNMRTRERKKRYTPKNKPPISTGGVNGRGFGPKRT